MLKPVPRLVVDVNILLNSITAPRGGLLEGLHTRFKQGELRYVLGQALLDEFKLILDYPKVIALGVTPSLAFEVGVDLLQMADYIAPVTRYDWPSVPDLKDWYLLDLLLEAEANYLLTQDKALLKAAKALGLPALHPLELRKAGLL